MNEFMQTKIKRKAGKVYSIEERLRKTLHGEAAWLLTKIYLVWILSSLLTKLYRWKH